MSGHTAVQWKTESLDARAVTRQETISIAPHFAIHKRRITNEDRAKAGKKRR